MENQKTRVVIDADLKDLIPGFLDNRKADIGKLKDALEKKDFETIQRIAHDLKGIGAGYGFDKISDIGLELENASKAHEAVAIRGLVMDYENYLDSLEVVYE
jgi:HPt (histidine-containing phosphotransfer) domain-containing protein